MLKRILTSDSIQRFYFFTPLLLYIIVLVFIRDSIEPYTRGGYLYDHTIYQVALESNGKLVHLPRTVVTCIPIDQEKYIHCQALFRKQQINFGLQISEDFKQVNQCYSVFNGLEVNCQASIKFLSHIPGPTSHLIIKDVKVTSFRMYLENSLIWLASSGWGLNTWFSIGVVLSILGATLGGFAGWGSLFGFSNRWRLFYAIIWVGLMLYILAPRIFFFLATTELLD